MLIVVEAAPEHAPLALMVCRMVTRWESTVVVPVQVPAHHVPMVFKIKASSVLTVEVRVPAPALAVTQPLKMDLIVAPMMVS